MRKKSRKEKSQFSNSIIVILLILGIATIVFLIDEPKQPNDQIIIEEYHAHADFLVIINNHTIDFQNPQYDFVDPAIHLHVKNFMGGKVIHIESRDATIGEFFDSLGIEMNETCFSKYCTNQTQILSYFVNGKRKSDLTSYKPRDLDQILVTYGNENEIEIDEQIKLVTDFACVFSGKCDVPPEAQDKIFYN